MNSTFLNETAVFATCTPTDSFGNEMVSWIYHIFGECVHTPLEQASFYVGLVSIALWMCALFPQIIANFKNRDASSLSAGFLAQNVTGDASNLLACILSGQLITQILLASYFVLMDFFLVSQYMYYVVYLQKIMKIIPPVSKTEEEPNTSKNLSEEFSPTSVESSSMNNLNDEEFQDIELKNTKLQSSKIISIFVILMFVSLIIFLNKESSYEHVNTRINSRKLLSTFEESESSEEERFVFPPNTPQSIIGYIIGCICAIMYVGSRLPQIYWNYSRKSTDGLSPTYFAIGIFGNMCYLTSIWLFSVERNYLLTRLPWLTESTINIFLDCTILSQYYYYTYFNRRGSMKYRDLESSVIPSQIKDNQNSDEKENHSITSIDDSSVSSVSFNEIAAMHELSKHLNDHADTTTGKSHQKLVEDSESDEKFTQL